MSQATSKERGDLLEDVVAALHEFPTIETQKRVFLPVIDSGTARKREIDVLLLSNVAGYPVRIAIECKNEKDPVGIQRIDEFLGKLNDVGIPPSHSVFVSPVGYTGPALERAAKAGIRCLQLDGLTQDRLGAVLNEALQSFTYLVAEIYQYDRFDDVPNGEPASQPHEELPGQFGMGLPAINSYVWHRWVTGALTQLPGQHTLFLRLPPNFRFGPDEPALRSGLVIVTLHVVAHVARIPGTAKHFTLKNAATSQMEKLRVEASFESSQRPLELEAINSEEELNRYHDSLRGRHVFAGIIRVPRIVTGQIFWPPSLEALERIRRLRSQGEEVTFAKVEGRDLSKAWEVFTSSHREHDKAEQGAPDAQKDPHG